MNTLGENIKLYRTLRGLTQTELGHLIGLKAGTLIYNWESGNGKPDYIKIGKLCLALHISADQLIGIKSEIAEENISNSEIKMIKDYRSLDNFGKEVIDTNMALQCKRMASILSTHKRPKLLQFDYYDIPASAGTGTIIEDQEPEKVYIAETPEAYKADFLIKVKGDSMEPTFYDGDVVLVKRQDTLEIGEIGIFILNGDSYIKELGKNQLISHNKTYKPIKFTDDDNPFCSGKVLGRAKLYEK